MRKLNNLFFFFLTASFRYRIIFFCRLCLWILFVRWNFLCHCIRNFVTFFQTFHFSFARKWNEISPKNKKVCDILSWFSLFFVFILSFFGSFFSFLKLNGGMMAFVSTYDERIHSPTNRSQSHKISNWFIPWKNDDYGAEIHLTSGGYHPFSNKLWCLLSNKSFCSSVRRRTHPQTGIPIE